MIESQITNLFSKNIRVLLEKVRLDYDKLYEIRLRSGMPLILIYEGTEYFLSRDAKMVHEFSRGYLVTGQDLKETMEYIGGYSLYAHEDELRQGFLTVQGGHRVGIAGKTVLDGERVKAVKYISCINVRIAHEMKGCADFVMPYVRDQGGIYHTLIISPPRCGKTTLLRDIIRQISNGYGKFEGYTVGVVDERSEIAGCYQGVPQNDLGIRTDVLDCCPKAEGMMMLIRSMSPAMVAVDEIGDYEDIHAIESVINCGCKLMATVHGSSMEDIQRKPLLQRLVKERTFERYILLCHQKRSGVVKAILDQRGSCLYQAVKDPC